MTFNCKLFNIEEKEYSSNYLDFYEESDVPGTSELQRKINFFS
jgi:hypothetical protein